MLPPWRIPVVVLTVFFCVGQLALAHPGQDQLDAKDKKILVIQQLIQDHNLAEALHLITEAAKEYPADAGFDNLSGIIEAKQGNYAAAEKSFLQASKRAPKFTAAYLNLGRLYQENSAADSQARGKALSVYGEVLTYDPKNADANYQTAALQLEQGDFKESLDHISRLPEESQTSAQTLSIVCADYAGLVDRKRTDEAAGRLLSAPDLSEPDARQALLGLSAGKRDDVIVSLLENLQKRQLLPLDLVHTLGLAYERTGRFAESRATLEEALVPESLTVNSLFELARVAREQQDYQGALGYLAHARELAPSNASVHYFFGFVCLDLDLLAEARNSFEKAVKLEPENPSYNYAMGVTSTFRQDPAEAVPFFEKFLKLRPQDPRGRLALGAALFRAKDYDAAIPQLTEAAKTPSTAPTACYYLGAIALQQRQLDDAFSNLQQALKAKPDYPDALAELGQYYLMRKDYGQAEKQVQHALKLDPDHYAANFYLLTIYTRTEDSRKGEQAKRFEELKKLLAEKSQEFLRIVEVRPLETP